jgi:hypothetical protein
VPALADRNNAAAISTVGVRKSHLASLLATSEAEERKALVLRQFAEAGAVSFRRKTLGQVSSARLARSSEAAAASLSSTRTCAAPESTNGKAPPASSALIADSIPAEASRP